MRTIFAILTTAAIMAVASVSDAGVRPLRVRAAVAVAPVAAVRIGGGGLLGGTGRALFGGRQAVVLGGHNAAFVAPFRAARFRAPLVIPQAFVAPQYFVAPQQFGFQSFNGGYGVQGFRSPFIGGCQ